MREETGEVTRSHVAPSCLNGWQEFTFSDSYFYSTYMEDRLKRGLVLRQGDQSEAVDIAQKKKSLRP